MPILAIEFVALLLAFLWIFIPEFSLFSAGKPINLEAIIVFLVIGASLTKELVAHSRDEIPHPNDENISRALLAFYDREMIEFLRDRDLAAGPISCELTQKIYDASGEWRGVFWRYSDRDLEYRFGAVRARLGQLSDKLATELELHPNLKGYARFWVSDQERATDFYETETFKRLKKLNDAASKLNEAIEHHVELLKEKHADLF